VCVLILGSWACVCTYIRLVGVCVYYCVGYVIERETNIKTSFRSLKTEHCAHNRRYLVTPSEGASLK